MEKHTAGSPTNESVKWTSLRPCEIACHLQDIYKVVVSHRCIKRVLKNNGFVKRKPTKSLATGVNQHRDEQFNVIFYLVELFELMDHNPILSIDTEKKEKLGQLMRNEQVLTQKEEVLEVYSSDYSHLAEGKVVPHGIFDTK